MLTLFGRILVSLGNEVIQYPTNNKSPYFGEIALAEFVDTGVLHVRLDDFEN